MKKVRNYDRRVKQTRIFLDDYFVVRGLSRQAGISMAEALHKLLVGRIPAIQPALKVPVARIALQYASEPSVLATSGSRGTTFGIKTQGVRYD